MRSNNGSRRFCANIYVCTEAAKFLQARTLSAQKDRCGFCAGTATYAEFMQQALILSCRMCTSLSGTAVGNGIRPETLLGECLVQQGRHCPLCALEYASLSDRDPDWILETGEVVRCFLGGPPVDRLAQSLWNICLKRGCSRVQQILAEFLALLDEGKKTLLERRIREVSRILNLELLAARRTA